MATYPFFTSRILSENHLLFSSLLFFFFSFFSIIHVFHIHGIQIQHRGVIWLAAFGTMGAMDWDRLFLYPGSAGIFLSSSVFYSLSMRAPVMYELLGFVFGMCVL